MWCSWSIFLDFALGLGDLTRPPEDWIFGGPSSMELDSRSRRLGVTLGVTEEESGFLRFQSLIMFYFCKKRRSGLTRCLKFTEKVSFNIASEASYVYILKVDKNHQKCQKWPSLARFSNATIWVIFKQCGLDRNEFLLSLGVVTNNASVETSVVIEEEFAIALPSPNLFWAIANVGGSQSFLF